MKTGNLIIRDKGWNRIKKSLQEAEGSYTKVGIQQGALHEPSAKGSKPQETSDLVKIAAIQEFGAPRAPGGAIPERSFLRSTIDAEQAQILARIDRERSRFIEGKQDVRTALARIGEDVQGRIQKKITDLREPKNSDVTIALKKSSNPLIDTGQLRQSIRHVEKIV